jgi:hypothetical protein
LQIKGERRTVRILDDDDDDSKNEAPEKRTLALSKRGNEGRIERRIQNWKT